MHLLMKLILLFPQRFQFMINVCNKRSDRQLLDIFITFSLVESLREHINPVVHQTGVEFVCACYLSPWQSRTPWGGRGGGSVEFASLCFFNLYFLSMF